MLPHPIFDASVSSVKLSFKLGTNSFGSLIISSYKLFIIFWCSARNLGFLSFNRSYNGLNLVLKFFMNGLNQFTFPNNFWSCLFVEICYGIFFNESFSTDDVYIFSDNSWPIYLTLDLKNVDFSKFIDICSSRQVCRTCIHV